MSKMCRWCDAKMFPLPSGVLVCPTCDVTPVSSIPIIKKPKA